MAQLNLGLFALVGVIMLVLAGASFSYLLRVPNKSLPSRMLMWYFLLVCGSAVATILTNLGTDWAHAFAPLQDALLLVGGIFLVRFAYVYPVEDQPAESRIVTLFYLGMAGFALVYALYFLITYLSSLPQAISEPRAFYLLTPLALIIMVGLFFRRFVHWRTLAARAETDPSLPTPSMPLPDQATYRRAASALRDFGLALSVGLIPLIVTVVPDFLPFLRGVWLSFLFNFGAVIAVSAMMLVYLSHAPDPTSVSARLVGISLASVMLVLGMISVWVVLNAPAEQASEAVLNFILLALIGSVFIIVVFPWFFHFTLLEPLERLLTGVRAANEGNLSVEVNVKYKDEIGYLTDSFNGMIRTLNEQALILTNTTQYLEQQVGERTAALESANTELLRQNTYQQALFSCSNVLLRPAVSEPEREQLLNEALASLLGAVEASRAYLFQNRLDPFEGEIMSMLAEAVAPDTHAHLPVPVNRYFPWSGVPQAMYATLQAGEPYGGPVEQAFAGHPELIEAFLRQQPPLLSVMLFPVQVDGKWWGYVGFDDCRQPRQWGEQEIQLLRTGAGMLSSVLVRWQQEDQNRQQESAQRALAQASRRLLQPTGNPQDRQTALAEALALLAAAAGASRGYLFQNQKRPENDLCFQRLASACAPQVRARLGGPLAGSIPWSLLPAETRAALESGQPVGGAVEAVLGGSPEMLDALQSDPILSILLYPLHFGDQWWGMIGFDDIETVRDWGDHEHRLLRSGADIFSQTLSRWQARDQLQHTLATLEEQVQQRTRQLSLSNARLLEEIADRKAAQQNLENRLVLESTLVEISQQLMLARDIHTAIRQSLADLGELLDARRISLLQLDDQGEVLSWQQDGTGSLSLPAAQRIRESFPWEEVRPSSLNPVQIHALSETLMVAQDADSGEQVPDKEQMLLVPLVAQNAVIGGLVCESVHIPDELLEETYRMLEVAAGVLSGALAHQRLLDELERKINARTRELAALYDLAILGGSSPELNDILQPMLSRIIEITASQAASIYLVDDDQLRMAVQLGLSAEQLDRRETIPLTAGLRDWLVHEDNPLAGSESVSSATWLATFKLVQFPHMRLVRLRARARFHGVLCCYRDGDTPYSPEQVSTLAAIGEQLGLIIENYHLRQEAEDLAGLHERQRLARELHDSVSQSLYSLTLFARAGRDALESADQSKLEHSLAEVEVSAKEALREMRLLLYQLRSEAVDHGLAQALSDRFQLVEHRLGIRTELEMADDLGLEPAVEQEIFRLASEALNNSVKHAQATRVSVTLNREGAQFHLLVVDDGQGFDPERAPVGLGLENMQARARLLGGALKIVSAPGDGTQVQVTWPAGDERPGR